ncbi:MAG TPA: hypothetical protein VIS07_18800 [Candidatus Binatia bacterium]
MRRPREGNAGHRRVGGRGDVIERKGGDEVDARIDQLTRELAEAINEAEAEGRLVRRDYAIDLLRDEVETQGPSPSTAAAAAAGVPGPLNPFAFGIPLLLTGSVLTFIFTPLGVALLGLGVLTCIVGVIAAVARSARDRWSAGGQQ